MSAISSVVLGPGSLLVGPPSRLSYRYKSSPANTVVFSRKTKFPAAILTLGSELSSSKLLHQQSCPFGGTTISPHISAAANVFSTVHQDAPLHMNYVLPQRPKSTIQPRVFSMFPLNIEPPKVEKKPIWWWRILACVPYLLTLQLSPVRFFLQPVLERHEVLQDLIYYIPGALSNVPTWFAMSYNIVAYRWLVKNKGLPHFFRYNLIMAMLLETSMGIIWHASNFLPLIYYRGGRFAEQYWGVVAVAFLVVVLWCVVGTINGIFCNVPFFSEAAMVHTTST